jgi:hypothetical protein
VTTTAVTILMTMMGVRAVMMTKMIRAMIPAGAQVALVEVLMAAMMTVHREMAIPRGLRVRSLDSRVLALRYQE